MTLVMSLRDDAMTLTLGAGLGRTAAHTQPPPVVSCRRLRPGRHCTPLGGQPGSQARPRDGTEKEKKLKTARRTHSKEWGIALPSGGGEMKQKNKFDAEDHVIEERSDCLPPWTAPEGRASWWGESGRGKRRGAESPQSSRPLAAPRAAVAVALSPCAPEPRSAVELELRHSRCSLKLFRRFLSRGLCAVSVCVYSCVLLP